MLGGVVARVQPDHDIGRPLRRLTPTARAPADVVQQAHGLHALVDRRAHVPAEPLAQRVTEFGPDDVGHLLHEAHAAGDAVGRHIAVLQQLVRLPGRAHARGQRPEAVAGGEGEDPLQFRHVLPVEAGQERGQFAPLLGVAQMRGGADGQGGRLLRGQVVVGQEPDRAGQFPPALRDTPEDLHHLHQMGLLLVELRDRQPLSEALQGGLDAQPARAQGVQDGHLHERVDELRGAFGAGDRVARTRAPPRALRHVRHRRPTGRATGRVPRGRSPVR